MKYNSLKLLKVPRRAATILPYSWFSWSALACVAFRHVALVLSQPQQGLTPMQLMYS